MDQLDWDANVDPNFKDNHYLEPVPVADTRKEGFVDRWIVYGKIEGEQFFTAKELTVDPGVKCTIKDSGAYGLICVQGTGKINGQPLNSPEAHPLHRTDRGRILLHRRRRASRRDLRKHQRNRTAGLPALLRAGGESGRSGNGRLPALTILGVYTGCNGYNEAAAPWGLLGRRK